MIHHCLDIILHDLPDIQKDTYRRLRWANSDNMIMYDEFDECAVQ